MQGQQNCGHSCGSVACSIFTGSENTKQSTVMMAKPINTRTAIPDGRGLFLMTSGLTCNFPRSILFTNPLSQWCDTLAQKNFHEQILVVLVVRQAGLFVQIAWLNLHFEFSVLAFLALLAV